MFNFPTWNLILPIFLIVGWQFAAQGLVDPFAESIAGLNQRLNLGAAFVAQPFQAAVSPTFQSAERSWGP